LAGGKLRQVLVWLALAAFGILGLYAWSATNRASEAEANVPSEAGRILSAKFAKSSALQVFKLTGQSVVAASDPGWFGWLPSSQRMRVPFTVDYIVDLSRVGPANYRWDAKARTMLVEIPDVRIAPPNVDESRAEASTASGLWVSRQASGRLRQQLSSTAGTTASTFASKPENMEKARDNARSEIEKLVRGPLAAAGLGNVPVVVKFVFERQGLSAERWDESTPLDAILGGRTAR
jgi:hypothetical protein